ncbi:tetratricopeptide repeat protein, partial [bacterium]|nr:tetratricopeptide repeat protein [bacterium]
MQTPDELRRKLLELERQVREAPQDPALHCRIAALLEKLDRPVEAVSELRQANQLRPGDPAILEMLGSLLIRLGEYDEALACYSEALDCVDGRASLHL